MTNATMRAFMMRGYGGPEQTAIREVPVPEPKPHEIRVRVRAAGLNPVDYKFRKGVLRAIQRPELPIPLGSEFSGVVEAVGAEVRRFAVGDRVFARVGKQDYGALAEFVCVDATFVARMPETLDFPTAAGVPLAGLTALQCLRDELHARPGMRLLITGGAGGVGTFAIQLAKWLGAEVTTTASPRGEALVKRLGADRVVDYTHERLQDAVRDMDGAMDLIGGETLLACFEVVKPGGKVVSIAGVPEPETARKDLQAGSFLAALFWVISMGVRRKARAHGVEYRYKFMLPSGEELAELAHLIDSGKLDVVVDRVFPFDEVAEAFQYLEQGRAKGKVIVTFPEA